MRLRYGAAAMFVGVVALLLAVRSEGYLGGRTGGGPLRLGLQGNGLSATAKAGESAGFGLTATLDGPPVEVQSVSPDFTSPGVRFRAARSGPPECGGCAYPRRGKLITRHDFDGEARPVVGLRATRPGAYYALGLITDYKRGIRRFRDYDEQTLCVEVGKDAKCGQARVFDAPLAEIGGPSDYGEPVREEGVGTLQARIDATRPRSILVPLVNLTDRTIKVSDLGLGRYEGPLQIALTPDPASFALRARAGRAVRLQLDPDGCLGPGSSIDFERLRARVDGDTVDVPLTVGLSFTAPCADAR